MIRSNLPKFWIYSILLVLILSACSLPGEDPTVNIADGAEPIEVNAGGPLLSVIEASELGFSVVLGDISGEVLLRQAEVDEFTSANVGVQLSLNGQVQTLTDGRARVDFPDQTIVRVGPDTLFTLVSIEEDSDASLLKKLFLEFGKVWVILNGGEMQIDTKSGVATVRGSYLSVEVDEETGEIFITCLEGTCTLESGGKIVTLHEGQTAQVDGAGSPPTTGKMTQEQVQDWLDNNPEAEFVVSSLGDYVWEDKDGDGVQNAEEPGIPEVAVALFNGDGVLLEDTHTDEFGYYEFSSVAGGEYYLKFGSPEGYLFTVKDAGADDNLDSDADDEGFTDTFTVTPGSDDLSLDAGLVKVQVGATCPLTGEPVENPDMLNLRPIFVSISHFPPKATRPPTGISWAAFVFELFIGEGQTRLFSLFYCSFPEVLLADAGGPGLAAKAPAVGDFVWADLNGNGLQDDAEPGVPGVGVILYQDDGTNLATTVTDGQGYYFFNNVEPGKYYLGFNPPEGFAFTRKDAGADDDIDSDASAIGYTWVFEVGADEVVDNMDVGLGMVVRIEGIRSGRIAYGDIAKYFGAGMIIGGADSWVSSQIAGSVCGNAFSNEEGHIGKGGLDVTRLAEIADECQTEQGNTDLDIYKFGPPPAGGEAGGTFLMNYNYFNKTKWVYDAALGGYVRYQNSIEEPNSFTKSVDRLTGLPIVRQNVIVLFTPHTVLNSAGTIINIDLDYRFGPAHLFRDGQKFSICWDTQPGSYETPSQRFRPPLFTDCNGTSVNLAQGKTWVNLVDVTTGFGLNSDGIWEARFYQPEYNP